MMERTIQHMASGVDQLTGRTLYRPGDMIVLVCPRGCEPITIGVKANDRNDEEVPQS